MPRFSSWFARAVFIVPLTFWMHPAAAVDWRPEKTWVFVVGVLKWQDSENLDSFPQQNRRDRQLVELMRTRGVPGEQIVYLVDEAATLKRVKREFKTLLEKTEKDSLLLVYYAGHGLESEYDSPEIFTATYDAGIGGVQGWGMDSMVKEIENRFSGGQAILLADCCHSGGLIRAVKKEGGQVSYVCLASSTKKKSSTGNWTFTESLLTGLRGAGEVDANEDGTISLREISRFAKKEMAFAEDQTTASFFDGSWDPDFTVAEAEQLESSKVGKHVEVTYGKDSYKGRVIEMADGHFRVFFYGYEIAESEWVEPKKIRWVEQ